MYVFGRMLCVNICMYVRMCTCLYPPRLLCLYVTISAPLYTVAKSYQYLHNQGTNNLMVVGYSTQIALYLTKQITITCMAALNV